MKWLLALVLFAAVSLTNGQTVIAPEHGLVWDDPNITYDPACVNECGPCGGWPTGYNVYWRLPATAWVLGYTEPMYEPEWPGHGPVPNVRTQIVRHLDFQPGTVVCFAVSAFNDAGEGCMTPEVCVIWPYTCEYAGDREAFIACVQAQPFDVGREHTLQPQQETGP